MQLNLTRQKLGLFIVACLFLILFPRTSYAITTDDLQQEINAISEGASATIQLQAGTYDVVSQLNIDGNRNVTFVPSPSGTTFKRPAESTYAGSFIRVFEGSTLTLSDPDHKLIFDGSWDSTSPRPYDSANLNDSFYFAQNVQQYERGYGLFITTLGSLTIDGASFKNIYFNSVASFVSPIAANGAQARIDFLDGEISNNHFEKARTQLSNNTIQGVQGAINSTGGLMITHGATLNMSGGVIANNRAGASEPGYKTAEHLIKYQSSYMSDLEQKMGYAYDVADDFGTGAISVVWGSKAALTGGTIQGNYGAVGGVSVGFLPTKDVLNPNNTDAWDYPYPSQKGTVNTNGRARPAVSNLSLEGASILDNHGNIDDGIEAAGGLLVSDFGRAVMNSGTISGNTSYFGGGVLVTDHYVDLTSGIDGSVTTTAKSTYQKFIAGSFDMSGGSITNNTAMHSGGGIFVSSFLVTLSAGTISNNKSFVQGGGIYVSRDPYVLRLNNSLVTNNLADKNAYTTDYLEEPDEDVVAFNERISASGGGLWLCPMGYIIMAPEEGGAIYGNTATQAGDDISTDSALNSASTAKYRQLSTAILGGGSARYVEDHSWQRAKADTTNEFDVTQPQSGRLLLMTEVDDTARANAEAAARLIISDNTSLRGGGIAANGALLMGRTPAPHLSFQKDWQNIPEDKRYDVTLELHAIVSDTDYNLGSVTLTKENNWNVNLYSDEDTSTFKNVGWLLQLMTKGQIENLVQSHNLYVKETSENTRGISATTSVTYTNNTMGQVLHVSAQNSADVPEVTVSQNFTEKVPASVKNRTFSVRILSNDTLIKTVELTPENNFTVSLSDDPSFIGIDFSTVHAELENTDSSLHVSYETSHTGDDLSWPESLTLNITADYVEETSKPSDGDTSGEQPNQPTQPNDDPTPGVDPSKPTDENPTPGVDPTRPSGGENPDEDPGSDNLGDSNTEGSNDQTNQTNQNNQNNQDSDEQKHDTDSSSDAPLPPTGDYVHANSILVVLMLSTLVLMGSLAVRRSKQK